MDLKAVSEAIHYIGKAHAIVNRVDEYTRFCQVCALGAGSAFSEIESRMPDIITTDEMNQLRGMIRRFLERAEDKAAEEFSRLTKERREMVSVTENGYSGENTHE